MKQNNRRKNWAINNTKCNYYFNRIIFFFFFFSRVINDNETVKLCITYLLDGISVEHWSKYLFKEVKIFV